MTDTHIAIVEHNDNGDRSTDLTLCGRKFNANGYRDTIAWHPKVASTKTIYQGWNDDHPATCTACILLLFEEQARG